jgi:hypothetical protein
MPIGTGPGGSPRAPSAIRHRFVAPVRTRGCSAQVGAPATAGVEPLAPPSARLSSSHAASAKGADSISASSRLPLTVLTEPTP